jgi:hypothetical protein
MLVTSQPGGDAALKQSVPDLRVNVPRSSDEGCGITDCGSSDLYDDPESRKIAVPAVEAFEAVSWAGFPIEEAEGINLEAFCVVSSKPYVWMNMHLLDTRAQCAPSEIARRGARTDLRRVGRSVL